MIHAVTNSFQAPIRLGSLAQRLQLWFSNAKARRAFFWTIVIVLGLDQAWSQRLLIDHDGVAYLDIAGYYAQGSWSSAINSYYSPLYSWLMAILEFLLRFPLRWESTVLHLINFAAYLGAYAAFEFFLVQLIRSERDDFQPADEPTGLSEAAWHTLGLGLFLYSSLLMANLSGHSGQGDPGSTPDIFVLLFVFLTAGLLLRMQSGQARWTTSAVFGAALSFGYFAKTAMFPLAFVFLAVAGFITLRQRKLLVFLLAPICFALLAGLWIGVLSHAKGRFLIGDAGRLTYRWLVGPRANPIEWGGQTQEGETLVHPPRQLSETPPIYEFAAPVPGTFPLWFGSSYWLEGKFPFSRVGQLRILRESYRTYWDILDHQKEFLVLLLVLLLLQGTFPGYFKSFLAHWMLWLPAIAALGMYATVHVEPRYIAAFLVLFWISLFAALRFTKNDAVQMFVFLAVLATVLTTGLGLVHGAITEFHAIVRAAPSEQVEVAAGLRKLGIMEGQSLATIGIPRDSFYWARLAHVRVISEIPTPNVNQYWFASPGEQEKIRSLFAQTGAVAIVTDTMPTEVVYPQTNIPLTLPGWQHIGDTSYFLFPLRAATPVHTASGDSKDLPVR